MAEPKEDKSEKKAGSVRFRYVGNHAGNLHSGAPLGIGEYVDLTQEDQDDAFNKVMIDEGVLIPAEGGGDG